MMVGLSKSIVGCAGEAYKASAINFGLSRGRMDRGVAKKVSKSSLFGGCAEGVEAHMLHQLHKRDWASASRSAPMKEEAGVDTSRLKILVMAAGMAVALLAAGSVVLGSMADDADAAKRPLLKTLWAVVDADGTIVRSKGVVLSKSGNVGTGAYGIFFNRNVSGCTYTATIGANLHGMISAFSVAGAPRAVEVRTHDKDGGPSNRPFNLLVNC